MDRQSGLSRCPECDQPQPPEDGVSLHLEDCSQHSSKTCLICIDPDTAHLAEIREN